MFGSEFELGGATCMLLLCWVSGCFGGEGGFWKAGT